MTKAALVALHSRKLANIRNQAVEHLEMMRKAVHAIRQAERLAEYEVQIDWSIVGRANAENSQVQNADYLTTLKISEKAAATRDQILGIAVQALEAELKKRANTTEKAKQAVKSVIDHRDLCKKNAEELLNSAQIAAQQKRESARVTAEDYSHLTPKQ